MKLQVNSYYLNAGGEIIKIVNKDDEECIYPYYDSNRSYTSDGKYKRTIETEYDLLLEIPKDKYKAFIEGLIND